MLGARAHIAYSRGRLGDLAECTRRALGVLPPLTGAHLSVYMNLGYEAVARIAFFAGDRESLEWAATALARAGGGRVQRRIAAIASAHISLFDGPRADPVDSRSDRRDAAAASPGLGDRPRLRATRNPVPLGRRCRRGMDRIRAGGNRAVRRRRQRRARGVLHAHARRRARPLQRRRRTSDKTLARPARDQLRT